MKKILILSSITMLVSLANIDSLTVKAADYPENYAEKYALYYETINTPINLLVEEELDGVYETDSEQAYRRSLNTIHARTGDYEDASKYLFPFTKHMQTTAKGLNYFEIDPLNEYKYMTLQYNHYHENIHINASAGSKLWFTTDVSNVELYLKALTLKYQEDVKYDTYIEIPIIKVDDVTIFGAIIDCKTTEQQPEFYYYSDVGELKLIEEYGYEFMKFSMPYQSEIHKIQALSVGAFKTIEKLEEFDPATMSAYTSFVPDNNQVDSIKQFLFEATDLDVINKTITFSHTDYHNENMATRISTGSGSAYIDGFVAEKMGVTVKETTTEASVKQYEWELSFKEEVDGKFIYNVTNMKDFTVDTTKGEITINNITYEVKAQDFTSDANYILNYTTYGDTCFKFQSTAESITASVKGKKYYAKAINYLNDFTGLTDTLAEPIGLENVNHFAGGFTMDSVNMSDNYFMQCVGIDLYFDTYKAKPINNVTSFMIQVQWDETHSSYGKRIKFSEWTDKGTFNLSAQPNLLVYNSAISQNGINEFNNTSYQYVLANCYTPSVLSSRLEAVANFTVYFNLGAYEVYREDEPPGIVSTNNTIHKKIFVGGEECDVNYGDEVTPNPDNNNTSDTPSIPDDDTSNTPNTPVDTPSDDNTSNEPILKDYFDTTKLSENLKTILPIALGISSLLLIISLIVKKKRC